MEKDTLLWQRFKDGDRTAFESMIRIYYRPLFEYGRKLMHDPDMLKDCIHDLFTSLWERRTSIGQTDNIKPYLLTSLRNRIFKEKQRSDLLVTIEDWQEESVMMEDDVEMKIISTDSTLENEHRIHHIMHTLTRRQQEIIHLKFYENLSNDEIAIVMAISRPAVSNLLHQSLKLFREKWLSLLCIIIIMFILF